MLGLAPNTKTALPGISFLISTVPAPPSASVRRFQNYSTPVTKPDLETMRPFIVTKRVWEAESQEGSKRGSFSGYPSPDYELEKEGYFVTAAAVPAESALPLPIPIPQITVTTPGASTKVKQEFQPFQVAKAETGVTSFQTPEGLFIKTSAQGINKGSIVRLKWDELADFLGVLVGCEGKRLENGNPIRKKVVPESRKKLRSDKKLSPPFQKYMQMDSLAPPLQEIPNLAKTRKRKHTLIENDDLDDILFESLPSPPNSTFSDSDITPPRAPTSPSFRFLVPTSLPILSNPTSISSVQLRARRSEDGLLVQGIERRVMTVAMMEREKEWETRKRGIESNSRGLIDEPEEILDWW